MIFLGPYDEGIRALGHIDRGLPKTTKAAAGTIPKS